MKKKLVYFIYAKTPYPEVYKIHYQCLKLYSNVFDEMQFIIAVDNDDNEAFEYYKNKLFETVSFEGDTRPIEFIQIKNDPENREYEEFKTYVIEQVPKLTDTYLFYAHGKGMSQFDINFGEDVYKWIYGMYYFNLEVIEDAEEKLNSGYDAYGAMPLNLGAGDWLFSGTFIWFNCNNFNKSFSQEVIERCIKRYQKRFVSERFIQYITTMDKVSYYGKDFQHRPLIYIDDYKFIDRHILYIYGKKNYFNFYKWYLDKKSNLNIVSL